MLKPIVFGAGNMGYAAAYFLLQHPNIEHITLVDKDKELLQKVQSKFSELTGANKKISFAHWDVESNTHNNTLSDCDFLIAATPWEATKKLIHLALEIKKPLVSISRPHYQELKELNKSIKKDSCIMLGCGLEPGLTEIFAKHMASEFSELDELHIRCGGIVTPANPPLNYKKIFGHRLPIDAKDAYCIENGTLKIIPRFSGIEKIQIENVGELEAWHDGMLPWIIDIPNIAKAKTCTQKTLRWPGFADKINLLHELGFLSQTPVLYKEVEIEPRLFAEKLLQPITSFNERSDKDMTVLQVEASGLSKGKLVRKKLQLLDEYDPQTKLTSMARVSSGVLSYIAILLAQDTSKPMGLIRPEDYVNGDKLDSLLSYLKTNGVKIEEIERISE